MADGIVAVVPCAGRGSRLGFQGPKILAPLGDGRTLWTVMREKLLRVADSLVVILSPEGATQFAPLLSDDPERDRIHVSLQESPTGMAPAIAAGSCNWKEAKTILVIWGDQVHVSQNTLERLLRRHSERTGPRVNLPLVELQTPYVQYLFDERHELSEVRETREGHQVDPVGFSDVGTFLLENHDLTNLLAEYIQLAPRSVVTGEINFLPFLVWLAKRGWSVQGFSIADVREARGVNDQEDLQFFRELYR